MGVKPERLQRRNLMHDECSGVATSYCLNVPGSNRESVSEIQSIKEMYQNLTGVHVVCHKIRTCDVHTRLRPCQL